MSRETSAAVHAQSINLRKKNSEARKLHLPVMRDSLKQDMKPFLQHLQGLFVNFAEQHQRQYTGKVLAVVLARLCWYLVHMPGRQGISLWQAHWLNVPTFRR